MKMNVDEMLAEITEQDREAEKSREERANKPAPFGFGRLTF
jgi:hypothetical protein